MDEYAGFEREWLGWMVGSARSLAQKIEFGAMANACVLRTCLFWFFVMQANLGAAQLTADSIRQYLCGTWEMCEVNQQAYYFDSDAGTGFRIEEHDEFSFKDSTLTFFKHGTFSANGAAKKKRYRVRRLLNAYESPFKIALGKTEFIFEIRYPGFILHRLILGTFDENESYSYAFARIGQCK